ncbi:hypothetical protein ACJMK2_018620 [Sinanodonta woodiana]|uniref:F5/8 type C domain-containing protein n=1 Tax=Sinanodonta woodiana TaxID=1069815 RepID=A0ABD3UDZ6_SINWO
MMAKTRIWSFLILTWFMWVYNGRADVCNSPLGLENGTLRNNQFSASSTYDSNYLPHAARLNSGGDGWIASVYDSYQHLIIDLEGYWNITGFAVQGSTNGWFTRELRISYSDDNMVWYPYNSHLSDDVLGEVMAANEQYNEIKRIQLDPTIKARFIAFNTVSFSGMPSLRLELYGCNIENNSNTVYTTIDNDIEDSRTWIPSQSPVVINRKIAVRPSGMLSIQPGVTVIFTTPESELNVHGRVSANGLNGVPVVFSGRHPVMQAMNLWSGIKLQAGGKASRGASQGLKLLKTVIHSCKRWDSIVQWARKITTFLGIVLHGSNPVPYITIENTEIMSNTKSGVTVENWDRILQDLACTTQLNLIGCKLSKNSQHGLETSQTIPGHILVENCSFEQNFQDGLFLYRWYNYGSRMNLTVSSSNFYGNAGRGIYIYQVSVNSFALILSNNNFTGNVYQAVYMYASPAYDEADMIKVIENVFSYTTGQYFTLEFIHTGRMEFQFQNNTCMESHGCLMLKSSIDTEAVIMYNRFKNIYGVSGNVVSIDNAVLNFTYNKVENCSTSTLLEIRNGFDHVIKNNNFSSNSGISCLLKVGAPFEKDKVILAPYNYWGDTDITTIKQKICDFYLNVAVARVKLQFYFADPFMENGTLIDIDNEDQFDDNLQFLNGSYLYGGIITGTLVGEDHANTPILVNRSILIEEAGVLRILGNNVSFTENRGIIVKGHLFVGSNSSMINITTLRSNTTGEAWKGIILHGGQLILTNTNISDVSEAITVNSVNVEPPIRINAGENNETVTKAVSSSNSLEVRGIYTSNSGTFINVPSLNGDLNILIDSSRFNVQRQTLLIQLNDTANINIRLWNSTFLSSTSSVISITEQRPQTNLTQLYVEIQNSTLNCEYCTTIYVSTCSVHFNLRTERSVFSSWYDSINIYAQSSNTIATQNAFTAGQRSFYFQFCNTKFESVNVSRVIYIQNNTFTTSSSGVDIYYYNWYTNDAIHTFKIQDNSFTQPGITDKQGFAVYSQNWYNTGNNYSLMNNSFYGYGTALNINGQANELQISHNTFLNNSYVLKLNIRDYRTGFVNISDNRIEHNRAEGIVQIQPSVSDENVRIHVINNSFENNTGSVITVSAPFILLRHNFFANANANYNLRVIPDTGKSFAGTIINASLTYWGTTDVNVIGKHIYDASYDASLPDVIFRPYLGSMNISNIQDEDSAFKSPTGEIGGMVKEYVTLSIDMSPYLVTSNIEIKEEGTLDLRAGVTLKFKENLGISVFGSLIALGNASHPVQLLSETDDQQWRGLEFKRNRGNVMSTLRSIHVNNTLNGVSINGNFSEISDVVSTFSQEHGFIFTITKDNSSYYEIKVENLIAANNTKSGVLIRSEQVPMNYPRIEIQTCLVQGNTESGFSIEANATVVISKCHILDNHLSGIYINTGGKTHLFSSVLSLNRQYALYAYSPYEVLLESCDVSDHNYGSYTHWGGWQTRHYIEIYFDQSTFLNVTMKNNRLFNNTADGIRLDISYSISSDYFISLEDNTFQNGNRTLLISDYSHWYSNNIGHIMIRNNTFENIIDSLFQLAYFAIYRVSTFGIMNNTFRNSVTANLIFVTGNVDVRYNGNITIYENNFLDNTIISTIVLNTYYETVTISENIFENMGSECEVVAPDFKSTYSIDAKFNFWGESNGESIVEKVCGFEKNMAKSFIYYVPYYIDDSMQQLAHEQDTFNMDGALGGEVTGVVNLLKQMSPYIISRSIMLRNDSKLIIEDGVILQFEKDRGIYALDESRLNFTQILQTRFGLETLSPYFVISSCIISDSSGIGLVISLEQGTTLRDFSGTIIENTNGDGIYLRDNGNISIVNVTVRNVSSRGIYLNSDWGQFKLSKSTIRNCSKAIEVSFGSSNVAGTFYMENCTIDNNTVGVFISAANYYSVNTINLFNNKFLNNKGVTLDVNAPSYQYWYVYDNGFTRQIDIGNNYFENNGDIMLQTWNLMNLTFHDNIVKQGNKTSSSNQCMLHALASGSSNITSRQFDISTNVFEGNKAECVIYLDTGDYEVNGTFFYNKLLSNKNKDSVVKINTMHFKLSQNIFDNPGSTFDLYVTKQGSNSITAGQNWWGSANPTFVSSRIFDYKRDITLLNVNVTPILTDQTFDCSGVNNCSGHGECVRPNGCRCFSGWAGKLCSDYDCAGVNFCYGNGQCVGPDRCRCLDGWKGDECIYATCNNVNNCSDHGVCIRPNLCKCAGDFTGNDCSRCVPLHWGPDCKPCPACINGVCDLNTGLCVCDGNNWAGYLCDRCNETFYGPNCLPLIMALNIIPSQGTDKGGNLVHVWGHNFPETQNKTYFCTFGTNVSNGTWIAWNHVVCTAPALPSGDIILEISPNGTTYTDNKLVYTYYATCPSGACGRGLNPPHGQCLFGGCSCNLPWTGDGCTVELLSPIIQAPPSHATVSESSYYSYQLNLTQGSAPITWTLTTYPGSMTINERNGLVEWQRTLAGSSPYQITAKATNIIGSHSIKWSIMVPRSYSAQATSTEPSGILPVPKPVSILGVVNFANGSTPRVVPVDVRVRSLSTGRSSVISELTNPLQPTSWTATYYPRPDDAGTFEVTAYHPAESSSNSTVTWSVLGMRCEPSSVSVEKVIENGTIIFQGLSKLVNVGGYQIPAITTKVDGLKSAFVRVSSTHSNVSFEPFLTTLNNAQEISFDLVVTDAKPLSGTIYVIFASDDGTTARLQVYIRLTIRTPLLVFSPNSISQNIIRGTQMIFEVMLSNQGEVAARNIVTDFPNDQRLSIVSFSNVKDNSSSTSENITIASGEVATMAIAVTIPQDAGLGEISGTIAVNSELASATIDYVFFITSIRRLNLTFAVKDEYTYFASGAPLVSGAEVRLSNPQRQYSEKRFTTNETGHVTFENIYEDQYTVFAGADGHSSYSAVILANPENNKMDIFLQRVAVKYTWTVTPTTVQDVYIITLESTFETFVPMPVVTIEPAKVNTIPYELGEVDTIEFTITNHGLIRADNLRFSLPTSHPYLNFKSVIESIGSIEANTTIIVPVKATLKSKTKRNVAAAAFCGLLLLYDYDCAGLQTRNLDVTLTREYPGRPPLPCGLGGGGGGGGGGDGGSGGGGGVTYGGGGGSSGSGSSVSYNPVTPLSCDCAKTLIKSCALAYHPIVGCAYAVADLGTSYARSGGDAILGTLYAVLALADTAFACVFGVICNLCGLFYTTIRCVIDISTNCGSARRRRDISSEVVENMIQAAKPVDNFLKMMADIYGDEAMYNLNRTWYDSFKMVVSDNSPGGTLLTADEGSRVLATMEKQESKAVLNKFLIRWNNTASAWENGTLPEITDTSIVIPLKKISPRIEQYLNDVNTAKQRGFDSIFASFDHAANTYKAAEKQNEGSAKDEGVCAKVRVRIVQELVLTRDAFNARLEIENGEKSPLENIKVEIEIRQTYGIGEPANNKFSIGKPMLNGITAVDGTGRLGMDISGYAEWLMIPYSNAAPQDDTLYDVGGRLSYTVGGSNFSVPLLPDTITVKPNPSLIVHYFHEKYVRGDDPLTENVIEPSVPFTLAVMVMNSGYGIARALKISSAQPEIIENEKGLMITFKIIGAHLGNSPLAPSLTVNFGDINSLETKTAKWLLTSTLKGTFYNYSATFQNINPLGDPQLSLLEELGYHELINLVRIDLSSNDDSLDDFLVNDVVDENGMPDRLFSSGNGSDVHPVIVGNVTSFKLLDTITQPSLKRYKIVRLTVVTNASSWFYVRVENNVTNANLVSDENLLTVVRSDEREILVDKNAWQTTHIKKMFLFHLLDFISQDSNTTVEIIYNLTFGPRNMYAPKFTSSEYMTSVSMYAVLGATILTLKAYDIDNDTYSFKIRNDSFEQFYVEKNSGEITVAKIFTSLGTITFEVVVEDFGIPSKSSFSVVIVKVHDENTTSLPTYTTETVPTITAHSTSVTNTTSTRPSIFMTNETTITTQDNPSHIASTLTNRNSIVPNTTPSSVVVTTTSSITSSPSNTTLSVTTKTSRSTSVTNTSSTRPSIFMTNGTTIATQDNLSHIASTLTNGNSIVPNTTPSSVVVTTTSSVTSSQSNTTLPKTQITSRSTSVSDENLTTIVMNNGTTIITRVNQIILLLLLQIGIRF